MKYHYRTHGTCSLAIDFDLTDDIVTGIRFTGGCNGNLKMLCKILDGWKAEDLVEMCSGNLCRDKGTSCADQLACAVKEAMGA